MTGLVYIFKMVKFLHKKKRKGPDGLCVLQNLNTKL